MGTLTRDVVSLVEINILMHLLLPLDSPRIVSPQATVYMSHGLSVQLNCNFDRLPVPTITWTSPNGSFIFSQSRFLVQSTTSSTSLTISFVLGGVDDGIYTCSASNSRGVSSSTIQLFVLGELWCSMKHGTYCFDWLQQHTT